MKQHPRTGDLTLLHIRVPARVAQALRHEAARQELSVSLCAASLLVRGLGLESDTAPEKAPDAQAPSRIPGAQPGAATPWRCQKCGTGYPNWVPHCGKCGEWNSLVDRLGQKASSR